MRKEKQKSTYLITGFKLFEISYSLEINQCDVTHSVVKCLLVWCLNKRMCYKNQSTNYLVFISVVGYEMSCFSSVEDRTRFTR
jgi:hypothetical protein